MESITATEVREGQRVRVHYSSGVAREGIVEQHTYYSMVFKQEDGSIGALFNPSPEYSPTSGWSPYIEKVELIYQPQHPHNRTDLDRLADATAEVERLQAVVKQRDADVSSALARESAAIENEQNITETLDDLKRKVGAEWVRLAEIHGWDMDTVERAIDHLDLEMPKPGPFDFTVSLDIDFTAYPATRKIAKQIDSNTATTEQITAILEKALTGLDEIDLDEDVLQLDPYRGMNVQIRDFDIN